MKLLVVGYGRHGKDTVCDILDQKYGLTFSSSSWFCAERFIFDALKEEHGYTTVYALDLTFNLHIASFIAILVL
jgi:hypothetical protein